jgi:hypothetical protein
MPCQLRLPIIQFWFWATTHECSRWNCSKSCPRCYDFDTDRFVRNEWYYLSYKRAFRNTVLL